MQQGGVITPMNGDLVVYREPNGAASRYAGHYVLSGFPGIAEPEVYPTYDAAIAAARAKANTALVNVFYCELPASPQLVTQFRAL
jgi:hypothetical protein